MTIYDDVKPIPITYHVVTESDEYRVTGKRCEIAQDDGIILFLNDDSVQAMFRLEDVKMFWRII
ncbi:hypothetical protein DXB97_04355 [Firmicutes bacterium OM07-11]|jgi:hypothetical protein|nr:hypothetical protein DXB97_04355 [Firmicutes bacterium OM07-11]DAL13718.1 MAG TPA_asm: hypothetical protein [Bacteriophage sp.]